MTNVEPTSPHDRFFKAVFSQRESAAFLFDEVLPKEVAHAIDADSLVLQPATPTRGSYPRSFRSSCFRGRARGRGPGG